MVMDATQWVVATDTYLANAPIVSGMTTLALRKMLGSSTDYWWYTNIALGNASNGAWLLSDIHPDKVWVEVWIYDRATGGFRTDIVDGTDFRGGVAVSYEDDIVGDAELLDLTFYWDAGDPLAHQSGCLSSTDMNLWLPAYFGRTDVDSVDGEIHIWIPYWWQNIDLIEWLWAMLKHHAQANGAIDDYFSKDEAIAVSDGVNESLFQRQLFQYYRQAGESFGKSFQRLLGGTDVWLGMGSVRDVGPFPMMALGMKLVHPEQLATDSTLIDMDDGGTEFIISSLKVTDGNEYLYNALKSRWGTVASMVIDADHGAPDTTAKESTTLGLLASPPSEELNTHELQDVDSIAAYGRKEATIEQPFLNSPDWSSSALDLRWSGLSRVIDFTMGPRGLSFLTGDVINVRDSTEGLDGTESWLVIEMVYHWDTLKVGVKAIEMLEPGTIEPNDFSLKNSISAWYQGEFTEQDATFPDILKWWIDQGPLELDAFRVSGFNYPALVPNAQNGLQALDFYKSGALAGGLRIDGLDVRMKTGWTIFMVIKPEVDLDTITADACLFSATPLSADNGFELLADYTGPSDRKWAFKHNTTTYFFGDIAIGTSWAVVAFRYYAFAQDKDPRVHGFPPDEWLNLTVNGVELQNHMTHQGPQGGISIDQGTVPTMEAWIMNRKDGLAPFKGYCGECLIYNRALDVHQFKLVNRQLMQRWAITA